MPALFVQPFNHWVLSNRAQCIVSVGGIGRHTGFERSEALNSSERLQHFWEMFPTVYILVLSAYGMDEENEVSAWMKAITDNESELTEIASPLALANKVAETLANAKQAGMEVVIPQVTETWASSVIQEFLFVVAEIARQGGSTSRLVDRDLFDPNNPSAIEWNEGITINDVVPYEGAHLDGEFWEEPEDYYQEFGLEPSFTWRFTGFEPTTKYLSGQYNRFFPLKIVMRVAANMLLNAENYTHVGSDENVITRTPLLLEELREEAAKVATYAKKRMEWLDATNGTEYGSWFSVALTDGSKKQNERFMSQFVGSVRSPGQGMPFELGLLVYDDGFVKLTTLGLQFALLENPILDKGSNWKHETSLSNQEKKTLLQAIKRNMPNEYEMISKMIEMVKANENTPTEIEKYLIENSGMSSTEASLARTGMFARLQELGLVKRVKEGRKIHYELV